MVNRWIVYREVTQLLKSVKILRNTLPHNILLSFSLFFFDHIEKNNKEKYLKILRIKWKLNSPLKFEFERLQSVFLLKLNFSASSYLKFSKRLLQILTK